VTGVDEPGAPHVHPEEGARHGRLAFRIRRPVEPAARTGLLQLGAQNGAELGLAWVPPAAATHPVRLVLVLHGAGGSARQGLELMLAAARERQLLLVAPSSRASTWDVIGTGYGPDVRSIDRLLETIAAAYPVASLTFAGFSDGASYALSLGLANGDVGDTVIAFSPGFAAPLVRHGRPRVFISHGRGDRVLPIDRCSRRLVRELQRDGYPVRYEEFDGGHVVPGETVDNAVAWLGP
jgi:predicted esterase